MKIRACLGWIAWLAAVGAAQACGAGASKVEDDGSESCTATGCGAGQYCETASGNCRACACEPGATASCAGPVDIETCKADCSGYDAINCGIGMRCDSSTSSCVVAVCSPGGAECVDEGTVRTCNADGSGWNQAMPCPNGTTCTNGQCVDPCQQAAAIKSNVGCEFWAVDMPNLPPRDTYVYAVVISNPSNTTPATIEIYDSSAGSEQLVLTRTVAPRAVELFNLSGSHNGITGHYPGDAGFLGNGIGQRRAFRVRSDRPVIATQFNPLGGASGFTTDASLLLPSHTISTSHIHLRFDQGYGEGSTLIVVGTEDNTTVTITPTVNTPAGTNGLPAMTAGQPTQITIGRYDYIQLSVGPNGQDLSGTRIDSSAPVAVFGGHTCANVPNTSNTACDHVEEQIFPLSTWGTRYVAARNPPRSNEPMLWRIVGSVDNTTLTFDPPVSIGATATIQAGQVLQFEDPNDFLIDASDPVLVAGYMLGCSATGVAGCPGDPYMVLMVPVEQYQSDYVFLVDTSYDQDFAKLIRPTGAQVDVACLGVVPDNRWTPVGTSGYEVAHIDMNPGEGSCAPGTNEAWSAMPFGIIVSGQAAAASYAYPGGLKLEEINIPK